MLSSALLCSAVLAPTLLALLASRLTSAGLAPTISRLLASGLPSMSSSVGAAILVRTSGTVRLSRKSVSRTRELRSFLSASAVAPRRRSKTDVAHRLAVPHGSSLERRLRPELVALTGASSVAFVAGSGVGLAVGFDGVADENGNEDHSDADADDDSDDVHGVGALILLVVDAACMQGKAVSCAHVAVGDGGVGVEHAHARAAASHDSGGHGHVGTVACGVHGWSSRCGRVVAAVVDGGEMHRFGDATHGLVR